MFRKMRRQERQMDDAEALEAIIVDNLAEKLCYMRRDCPS